MNQEIASILKDRLKGIQFVEVLAGLAHRVEYTDNDGSGRSIRKAIPVSHDVDVAKGCRITPERELVPDSGKKGILYFEDLGSRFIDRTSNGSMTYSSRMVLVCWMNRARLVGDHYKQITSYCITTILGKLKPMQLSNVDNFSRFKVTPGRILPQDASVFSRYTYDETTNQYLRPPFEFFGMELEIEYSIHPECVKEIEFKDTICY